MEEIEAKFSVADLETFRRLEAATELAGFRLGEGISKQICDIYMDSEDRSILAAGFSFRRRTGTNGVRYTLKGLGGVNGAIHQREELELVLSAVQGPAEWPDSPLKTRLFELIGQKPLLTLFELYQTRHIRNLLDKERPVAELCLDDVCVTIESREQAYFELECELIPDGTAAELDQIAVYLQTSWGLQPEPRSKFERGLDLLDVPPSQDAPASPALPTQIGLTREDSMAEAARKILWFHWQQMLAHEAGTRLGSDSEELHDMRVAVRRMRMAIELFGAYLDEKSLIFFARGLQRTGRRLGAVRDLDVFREKAQAYLATLPAKHADDLEPLLQALKAQRKIARRRMIAYLDGREYARFVKQAHTALQQPGVWARRTKGPDNQPLPTRLSHVAPVILTTLLAEIWAYDDGLRAEDPPLEHFHMLRIAFKRLRYALEFFNEVLGPSGLPLIEETKGFQDHLGDLQDATIASELLRNFLAWGTLALNPPKKPVAPKASSVAPGVAAYLAERQKSLQELVCTFPAAWSRLQGEEWRQRFSEVLRALW